MTSLARVAVISVGLIILIVAIIYLRDSTPLQSDIPDSAPDYIPCDSVLSKDVFFKDIWIGMHQSDYNTKERSARLKFESNEGVVTWTPIWSDSILVQLSLHFEADKILRGQGAELTDVMDILLAQMSFREMFMSRLDRCPDTAVTKEDDVSSTSMRCGRVTFLFSTRYPMILVYDDCYIYTHQQMEMHNDSMEVQKTKNLFK